MLQTGNSRTPANVGVTVSSVALAAFGVLLLFAPQEVSEALTPAAGDNVLVQLYAAAVLGFAAMNWTARGSALGGIYGRAIVAGNQVHVTIGALLLVSRGLDAPRPAAYWILTGLYVCGAVFFSYLTFFSSGIRER